MAVLSYYQRFESTVALILTILVGMIIVVALVRLIATVASGLVLAGSTRSITMCSRRYSARS